MKVMKVLTVWMELWVISESPALHVNVDIKVNKALQCFIDHASLVSAETQLERIRKYLTLIRKAIVFFHLQSK